MTPFGLQNLVPLFKHFIHIKEKKSSKSKSLAVYILFTGNQQRKLTCKLTKLEVENICEDK